MGREILMQTERFDLRRSDLADVDACLDYMARADVCKYHLWEPMDRKTMSERILKRADQAFDKQTCEKCAIVIIDRASGRLIGEGGFTITDRAAAQAEIGYTIHPDMQGQGVATEVMRTIVGTLFERFDMHRVFARCDARNTGSWRVMEKLGMRREAHFREHALFKGEWDEELHYAILDREWREQN